MYQQDRLLDKFYSSLSPQDLKETFFWKSSQLLLSRTTWALGDWNVVLKAAQALQVSSPTSSMNLVRNASMPYQWSLSNHFQTCQGLQTPLKNSMRICSPQMVGLYFKTTATLWRAYWYIGDLHAFETVLQSLGQIWVCKSLMLVNVYILDARPVKANALKICSKTKDGRYWHFTAANIIYLETWHECTARRLVRLVFSSKSMMIIFQNQRLGQSWLCWHLEQLKFVALRLKIWRADVQHDPVKAQSRKACLLSGQEQAVGNLLSMQNAIRQLLPHLCTWMLQERWHSRLKEDESTEKYCFGLRSEGWKGLFPPSLRQLMTTPWLLHVLSNRNIMPKLACAGKILPAQYTLRSVEDPRAVPSCSDLASQSSILWLLQRSHHFFPSAWRTLTLQAAILRV